MTDATPPKSGDAGSSLLDTLTGKVGKITALVVGVAALLTAVQTLVKQLKPPAPPPKPPVSETSCLKAEMSVPGSVTVRDWPRKMFILKGKNECVDSLQARIEFAAAGDRVRVEPPLQGGVWMTVTVDSGDVDMKIMPPALTPLKLPLGGLVPIAIQWKAFNPTGTTLRSGLMQVELQDDDRPAR